MNSNVSSILDKIAETSKYIQSSTDDVDVDELSKALSALEDLSGVLSNMLPPPVLPSRCLPKISSSDSTVRDMVPITSDSTEFMSPRKNTGGSPRSKSSPSRSPATVKPKKISPRIYEKRKNLVQWYNSKVPGDLKVSFEDVNMITMRITASEHTQIHIANYKGTIVAVKEYNTESVVPLFKDFATEVSTLISFRHTKYVVGIVGVCLDENCMWILMEYCGAGCLTKYLKGNSVSNDTRLSWVYQMFLAVNELHKANPPVIHGDLKSQNILLKGTEVRLCDFGSTKQEKKFNGTLRWASPECLARYYDEGIMTVANTKEDVWSLGVVVWEIYTNCNYTPYYSYKFDIDAESAIRRGELLEYPPNSPEVFVRLTNKCMRLKPEDRYSCEEALIYLRAWVS